MERFCAERGFPLAAGTGSVPGGSQSDPSPGRVPPAGFEEKARRERRAFLLGLKEDAGGRKILTGHTADDQVETILMRIMEGAGISGLKGIPATTRDGFERPLLGTWREEILEYLEKRKVPFRIDGSNFDTRFERNWIRHVLVPLLRKRYGKPVTKRIFALGERFREIDEFLDAAARRWTRRNATPGNPVSLSRKRFGKLFPALRKRILQLLCFEGIGIIPNERLLESMDRLVVSGGPSSMLNIGRSAVLRCVYDQAIFTPRSGERRGGKGIVRMNGPGRYACPLGIFPDGGDDLPRIAISWKYSERPRRLSPKRLAAGERAAVFDADLLSTPLSIGVLRRGEKITLFGRETAKKIKEILIDKKVPREERRDLPVVRDSEGAIVWIPGIARSAIAKIGGKTRRAVILRMIGPVHHA